MTQAGTVELLTTEQARDLRAELIRRLGIDEVDLPRVNRYALSARELAIYDDIQDLDYLLSD